MADPLQDRERKAVVYDCLAHPRRRRAISCLNEAETPLTLAELAEKVADSQTETPGSGTPDESVEDVRVTLYHVHLPKLEDADLVQHDQDQVELLKSPEEMVGSEQLPTE